MPAAISTTSVIPTLSAEADRVFSTTPPDLVRLDATAANCIWGRIDPATPAVCAISSGTTMHVQAVTHHAGDAPDLMMDDAVRELWSAIPPAERGPGVHILTGPIHVDGARPGDTLAIQILEMRPRLAYGSNLAANWGLLYDDFQKERITIYGLDDVDGDGFGGTASPRFAFDFTGRQLYDEPGFVTTPAQRTEVPFSHTVRLPVRPHFGVVGVAPAEPGVRSSIPPGVFGGNVDNWRFGPGSTVFLPVFQEGAGLYFGDPHFAQGDGEICGTAIEASCDAIVRIAVVDDLVIKSPTLVHDGRWFTHGFGNDLNEAMRMAATLMIELLRDRTGISADDAYSLCSVAMDLGVTQVVDGVVGCHAAVSPSMFVTGGA